VSAVRLFIEQRGKRTIEVIMRMTLVLLTKKAGKFAAFARAVKESPMIIEYASTESRHMTVIAVLIIGADFGSTDLAHVSVSRKKKKEGRIFSEIVLTENNGY
jgi:hypothetical protein